MKPGRFDPLDMIAEEPRTGYIDGHMPLPTAPRGPAGRPLTPLPIAALQRPEDVFVCVRLCGARLTAMGCVARQWAAARDRKRSMEPSSSYETCISCPDGRAVAEATRMALPPITEETR